MPRFVLSPTINHFWIIFRIVILSLATFDEKKSIRCLFKEELVVKRTDNPFRDLCFSIACNDTIFFPFIRICMCLREDRSNNLVVCCDLYSLGIWRVRNMRKLQIWNKRSREKVFYYLLQMYAWNKDLFQESWVLPTSGFFVSLLTLLIVAVSFAPSTPPILSWPFELNLWQLIHCEVLDKAACPDTVRFAHDHPHLGPTILLILVAWIF